MVVAVAIAVVEVKVVTVVIKVILVVGGTDREEKGGTEKLK